MTSNLAIDTVDKPRTASTIVVHENKGKAVPRSHLDGVVRRQQVVDPALFAPVDDGLEGCGQVGMGLDGVDFAGFDQRSDGGPVFGTAASLD